MSDRHVFKGRGVNRGKYLREAYDRSAQKVVVTWEEKQSRGSRYTPDSRGSYQTNKLAVLNGYLVKLVAPKSITAQVPDMQDFIAAHSAGATRAIDDHWFGGDFHDAGEDFCWECAKKLVDKKYAADPKAFEHYDCETEEERYHAVIDGGFDIDHDSPPRCATCDAKLSGFLTEYGADEELEALTDYAAPTFDDCEGWDALSLALINVSDNDPRWRKIAKVIEAARKAEQELAAAQAAFAATPGMAEQRGGFLALLAARAEQKAPEPSFRLWDEFQAWMLVRHDETQETKATEKRLAKEAIVFLGHCGISAYMTNGGMVMAEAAHGTYYWPFIVETEQRKLWKDVDLAAGREVGLACLASDDAPGRDANPFERGGPDAPRARAWDDGFLVGLHEASGKGRAS